MWLRGFESLPAHQCRMHIYNKRIRTGYERHRFERISVGCAEEALRIPPCPHKKYMKIFRKLVRDNVPEIMIKDGSKPTTRVLAEPEYLKALDDKLLEEVQELRHGDEDRKEEMADIYEVLDAMAKVHGFSKEDILRIQEEKRTRRGGFEKRIFLESAE